MNKSIIIVIFIFSTVCYAQKIKPTFSVVLSDSISETSGLLAFDGLLWTHNDDHDTTLYGIDTLGKIRRKVTLKELKNNDWEEISQDEDFVYIGDFGNNYKGNRTNLRILKIDKSTFYETSPKVEIISFSYETQQGFTAKKPNSTNFDCEAFVVSRDSIYLFTKEWSPKKSTVFVLPKLAGTYTAKLQTTLTTKGMITGATLSENKIVLCGYSKKGKPFLYVITDFENYNFEKAKKQKIKLKLPFHQVEGIATFDGFQYYITNEKLVVKPILNTKQQLHLIDLNY